MKFKAFLFLLAIMMGALQPAVAQKKKNKKDKGKVQIEEAVMEQSSDSDDSGLQNYQDSISYAFGVVLGHNLKAESVYDLDFEVLIEAMQEVLEEKDLPLDGIASRNLVNQHIQKKRSEAIERNLEKSNAFLAENAKKENIITTDSGLQYEILVEGDGATPGIENKVKTHYHGTLIDGTVFDSSVDRGEPLEFPLKGVIKGWTEALQLMKVGSKYRIYVPPALGYGDHGAGQKIGPNMALIFEIELLDIVE